MSGGWLAIAATPMLAEVFVMHVPAGGPSTINGVLYQMLWSLLRTTELHISKCEPDQNGVITNTVVLLEPIGGGGDFQELGTPTELVDQIKSRSNDGTWSLKEVIEDVLPDLYHAVNLLKKSVCYRFVTEGRIGQWENAYKFFTSLKGRVYDLDALDDIKPVFSSRKSNFWEKQEYTERTLFDKIVESLGGVPKIKKSKSPEDIHRKLWHLLGNFVFVGSKTQSALQKELDKILLAFVVRDSDLVTKRDAMLLDLARRATSGDAMIRLSDFMTDHKLDSVPWTDWLRLCQRSRKLLVGSLERRRYDPVKDVRYDAAREAATQWPDDMPLFLVTGGSGQGKSWFLSAAAHALSKNPQLAVLVEATGDLDKDIQHIERDFRFIRNTDEALPLDRIAERLHKLECLEKPSLTLIIDGVQDMQEAREIALTPWEEWGFRVAVSCHGEIADLIETQVSGRCQRLAVSDFTTEELHSYLNQALGDKWIQIAGDVRTTLCHPLLASIYVEEVANRGDWFPVREYELFDAVWRRLHKRIQYHFPQDTVGLKKLALDVLLKNKPYPWLVEQLDEAGLDDEAVRRLCSVGWLRRTGREGFEVPHDRLLNWAVAEALVAAYRQGRMDHVKFLDILRLIYHGERIYSSRYLGYVLMDILWMLVCREDGNGNTVVKIIEVLQPTHPHESNSFYDLLSTIGDKMAIPLISWLRKVSNTNSFLANHVVNGITSLKSSDAPEQANALLIDESPRIQRSGMRLLAGCPTAKALDRLWALHTTAEKDPTPFQREHDHKSAVYQDSFQALAACLKKDPSWIERTIRMADPENEPVHDLAYLLAGLEDGEFLWQRCKSELMEKVKSDKERSIARCIYRYRDKTELVWLEARIDREDGLVGTTCLQALAVIQPKRAIFNLNRLSTNDLYMTRGWAAHELFLRSPKDTQEALLNIIRSDPNLWRAASVYQGSENAMGVSTLEFLLDQCAQLLQQIQETPPPENKHPLWNPLSMLAAINDLELLGCFERRSGSCLENLLIEWMLSREPRPTAWSDVESQYGLQVLYRIGGCGFIEIVNAYLQSESQYGRLDGLKEAVKRYDAQTTELLRQIVTQERLWDDKFPLEQNEAARTLAIHEDWPSVVNAIEKLGAGIPQDIIPAVIEARREGKLADLSHIVVGKLAKKASLFSGDIMLLGLLGVKESAEQIQRALEEAAPDSEMAVACVLALGYLEHDDEKSILLLAQQLVHHRFAASNALFRINTSAALQAVMAYTREHPEVEYILPLLSHNETKHDVLGLIQELLRECRVFDLRMKLPLVVSATDKAILADICEDCSLQERMRKEAFRDEGSSWVVGSKAAAIRCLATFDNPMAFLAAKTALRNENAHDRTHYAQLLMDIDKVGAISVIIEQAGKEKSQEVHRSLCGALGQTDAMGQLKKCLYATDAKARLAACRLLPWQEMNQAPVLLHGMLDDPCEEVTQIAGRGLEQLSQRKQADALLAALSVESDKDRWWILLDSAIAMADPGGEHGPWPQWARDVCDNKPYLIRQYVGEQIKRRRKELAKDK